MIENNIHLPPHLCNRIFIHQFQLDSAPLSEQLLTRTVQLYVEAISFYSSLLTDPSLPTPHDPALLQIRSKYYQQKIKKLLVRTDVQQCLVGKRRNPNGLDLQKELAKVEQIAPQQARALLQYYQKHIQQQENIIESSLARQNNQLQERIQRRSRSKQKNTVNSEIQIELVFTDLIDNVDQLTDVLEHIRLQKLAFIRHFTYQIQ